MKLAQQPVLFISHGGGPWPFISEMKNQYKKTTEALAHIPSTLPEKPKAILSITAHWEEPVFTVSSATTPEMIYDYSGFPENTYHIKYQAAGSPEIAARVRELLTKAHIESANNPKRGFDHGTFVPLFLMYPKADVPVISMSIKDDYDPLAHIKMGQALQPLRDEGVLIVGSGLSYHNMRGFGSSAAGEVSQQFGGWLEKTISEKDAQKRIQLLQEWEKAPAARQAHPYEDHLVPLMAVVGAAGNNVGHVDFLDHVMGVDMASYRFEK